MRNDGSAAVADLLMRGPRGRRLLLEYARESETRQVPERTPDSFGSAVFWAAHRLDPGSGTSRVLLSTGKDRPRVAVVTPEEVATRLAAVDLEPVSPELLRDCLAQATSLARYWQEPDGEDVLAVTPEMRHELRRVAEHVAASDDVAWWRSPVDERSQWTVQWEDSPPADLTAPPRAALRAARDRQLAEEVTAHRERPSDPAANFSGEWWSRPPWGLPSSTRAQFDGSPVGLWSVEDGLGWQRAATTRLHLPDALRIFEIDAAEAWAELCARFPLEVTAQKRHDWYRTTGRAGRWVVPDWAGVAEHYDAVHLQVGTYLAAAGTAIPVGADTASVIAGWDPDQTYWFAPGIRFAGEPVRWILHDLEWVRVRPYAAR